MRVLVDVRPAADQRAAPVPQRVDVTVAFPELARPGRASADDVLLDGEVVLFLDGGPTFGALAERMHVARAAARGPAGRQPTR